MAKKKPRNVKWKLEEPYRSELGANLFAARMKRGLGRKKLADAFRRNKSTIREVEYGRASPSLLMLYLWAEALKTPVTQLIWID